MISSGVTLHDYAGFSSSLRLRYFGPRDLTSDGIYQSQANGVAQWGDRLSNQQEMARLGRIFEFAEPPGHDIDYAYASRISPTATSEFTHVFHPVEPFQVRFGLGRTF